MVKRIKFIWLIAAIVMSMSCPAMAAPSTSIEIKTGAKELQQALDNLPYTKDGTGPVLYLFEFSECPYCQQLYNDFNGTIPGVETRYLFYAVSQRSANETAALGLSRNIKDYHAFMKNQKSAPAANSTNASIDAYNAIQGALTKTILPTLQKNGWRNQSLVSPTFIWEENGRLYVDGGYRKDYFETILASIKSSDSLQPLADNKAAATKMGTNNAVSPATNTSVPALTWRDLVGHPERWPAETSMTISITVDRDALNKGLKMAVYDVTATGVELVAPKGYTINLEPGETTLLSDANAYWATLTPEQRALTLPAIAADRSLWPSKVTITETASFGNIVLNQGQELSLVEVRGNEVGVYDQRSPDLLFLDAKFTDLFKRSRKLASMPAAQRPGMMTEILNGLTMDSSGKQVAVKDARYYVFYFSASTCGRCHVFTPEFVKFYNENFAGRDDVAFITWPTEPAIQPMLAYMKKESIPWLTLPANQKGRVEMLINKLGIFNTPGILVVDKYTKPLLATGKMSGQPLDAAAAAVIQLPGILKK